MFIISTRVLTQCPEVKGQRQDHVFPGLQHGITAHEALNLATAAGHQRPKGLDLIGGVLQDQYTEVSRVLIGVTPVREKQMTLSENHVDNRNCRLSCLH